MVANPLLLSSITLDNSYGLQILSGDQISVDKTIEDDDVIISAELDLAISYYYYYFVIKIFSI